MQRVLHGAQRGLGVVGAVQIVAGAQLQNDARLWHRCSLSDRHSISSILDGLPRSFSASRRIRTLLKDGTLYQDLGSNHFQNRSKGQQTNRLIKRLADLGYDVALTPRTSQRRGR